MSIKIFSFDTETSGLSKSKNGIHQFAFRIYIDYVCTKEVKVDVRLDPHQEYEVDALKVSGKTIEQVQAAPVSQKQLYLAIVKTLSEYCDKFDKKDKFFLMGYNNHSFDNEFLRALFLAFNDQYFGSWFWSNSLDVMLIASYDLATKRHLMPNFKLTTVAREYGFDVDESSAHDAFYDLTMHEYIWQKTSGIQLSYLKQ